MTRDLDKDLSDLLTDNFGVDIRNNNESVGTSSYLLRICQLRLLLRVEADLEADRMESLRNPRFQTLPAFKKRAKQEAQWREAVSAARRAQSLGKVQVAISKQYRDGHTGAPGSSQHPHHGAVPAWLLQCFTSQAPGERGPAGPRHPQPTGLHVSKQGRGLLHCGDSHKGRSSEASSTETKKQQLAVSESVKTINQTKRQKSYQRLFHLIMLHKEDHEAEVRDRLRLHLLPQQQRHCDQPG